MKSQAARDRIGAVQARAPRSPHSVLALLFLLLLGASLVTGCARLKEYSLDTWQGPLPMHDLQYVNGDP